jgi:regulatory protein RepA
MWLDLTDCFTKDQEPLDFVFCGLVAGTVGNISAPGATSKSFVATEIALGVASIETDNQLLKLSSGVEGSVVIYNAEDIPKVVFGRLRSIGDNLSSGAQADALKNIKINCMAGKQPNIEDNTFLSEVIKECEGKRLIIFDTFTKFHQKNENDNSQMSQVVSFYEKIATETGAGVLFLHHNRKGAVLNGQQAEQQATRGASSITDNCRWQGFLQKMSEAEAISFGITEVERDLYVKFGGNKENYGTKTVARWLRKHAGGVLLNSDLPVIGKAKLKLVERDFS